ncbi:MAG TPA: efflux RND transporter periplasmic adaptor subunit [Polyangiaceae bacterium]
MTFRRNGRAVVRTVLDVGNRGAWLGLALGVAGCDRPRPPEPHAEHGEHAAHAAQGEKAGHGHEARPHHAEHGELLRRVRLSDEVARAAKLALTPARREVLAETLALPGELAGDPDRIARISSPAAGRIEEVRLREGATVKKGDVLVVVRVPEITRVRSAQATTKAKGAAARANVERLKKLLAEGLATEQSVIDAEAEANALEVETRSLGQELGALGAATSGAIAVSLRAPLDGTVVSRDAVVGQPVTPDRTLGTIAALDELWFLGRVFEKDLGRLRTGAPAEVRFNAFESERFTGSVEYLGQAVDPAARTINARIRLQNRNDLLRIGLFGTAEVALPSPQAAEPRLVVPRTAVSEVAGRKVVFVKLDSGEFEPHEVTLGAESVGKVEVLVGLGEGELVVSDGAFTLKSLLLKESFAEDDHH